MASTFAELFSDYQNAVKKYTEELDFTETQFMRDYTRGMQKFQRETEYVEARVIITRDPNTGIFSTPLDILRIIEVRDEDGELMLGQEYNQLMRNVDKTWTGKLETPIDYMIRTRRVFPTNQPPNLRNFPQPIEQPIQYMWTIFDRNFMIYPAYNKDTIIVAYKPDIHAFSVNSIQWAAWFQPNAFANLFNNSQVNPVLSPYEDAFLQYAIARYIKSKGSANFQVYEAEFWQEIERAKINKPIYFQEAVRDYFFAPYS